MASIGQLAAGIAHEINNPLSFVVLNLNHITNYGRGLLNIVEQYDKVATLAKGGAMSAELEAGFAAVQDTKAREEFEEILEELPSLLQESQDGAERIRLQVLATWCLSWPVWRPCRTAPRYSAVRDRSS